MDNQKFTNEEMYELYKKLNPDIPFEKAVESYRFMPSIIDRLITHEDFPRLCKEKEERRVFMNTLTIKNSGNLGKEKKKEIIQEQFSLF